MALIILLLFILVIVFSVLPLTGCLSTLPGIPGIYLVKIGNVTSSALNLRVGYYGICVSREGYTQCLGTSHGTTGTVIEAALAGSPGFNTTLPHNLTDKVQRLKTYSTSLTIQSNIFSRVQTGSAVVSCVALLALLLQLQARRRIKTVPNATRDIEANVAQNREITHRMLGDCTLLLFAFAALLSLIAAVTTMQTAIALEFATTNFSTFFEMQAGGAILALQWLLFFSLTTLCIFLHLWTQEFRNEKGTEAEEDGIPLVQPPASPTPTPAPSRMPSITSPSRLSQTTASISPRFRFPALTRPRPVPPMGPPMVAGTPIPHGLALGSPRLVVPSRVDDENDEELEPELSGAVRYARVVPAGMVRPVDVRRELTP
ncbi:hypothetical protein B0T25DRAFT_586186 [Lasiosphaeria hispida]|uniref:Pali-domain-containing protein n=1 Tax=Lasiosphaeria hispida TaxID=260671 RepID=A0AAJ0M8Y2_9PEZI|nr:hypothetical protein B0T25DRAFT_586186 [Lasiosphaeria hispida]